MVKLSKFMRFILIALVLFSTFSLGLSTAFADVEVLDSSQNDNLADHNSAEKSVFNLQSILVIFAVVIVVVIAMIIYAKYKK